MLAEQRVPVHRMGWLQASCRQQICNCPFPFSLAQLIVEQQDEQLELVSGSIGVLKNMSQRIGGELEEQAV